MSLGHGPSCRSSLTRIATLPECPARSSVYVRHLSVESDGLGFCHQELLVISGGVVLASPGKAKEGGGKNRRTVLRSSATVDDR